MDINNIVTNNEDTAGMFRPDVLRKAELLSVSFGHRLGAEGFGDNETGNFSIFIVLDGHGHLAGGHYLQQDVLAGSRLHARFAKQAMEKHMMYRKLEGDDHHLAFEILDGLDVRLFIFYQYAARFMAEQDELGFNPRLIEIHGRRGQNKCRVDRTVGQGAGNFLPAHHRFVFNGKVLEGVSPLCRPGLGNAKNEMVGDFQMTNF